MAQLQEPKILDVTIRDGSYLLNHQVSPKMVSEIVPYLAKAGIEYAEVSHGCGIGAKMMGLPGLVDDEELLEAAKKAAPDLKLSAFISANDYSLPLIPALVDFIDLGRVGVELTQVEKAEKIIAKLKKYHKQVSIQLVRSHAYHEDTVAKAAKQAESMGVDIIYLVDTFGSFLPEQVRSYLQAMQAEVKVTLGFHGHNPIGMAISNTLSAWEQGATWLDASLLGVGRGAGNANLEMLITILQTQGFYKNILLASLCEATEKKILPLFNHPPYSHLRDLVLSQEKFDITPEDTLELMATFLHLPLEELGQKLRTILGDATQVTQDHLKILMKQEGQDPEKFFSALEGKDSHE